MKSGMAELHSDPIRNIALLGHSGSGKSTLIEALPIQAGAIPDQEGQGRRITDCTPLEQQAGHSLETSLFHLHHQNTHVNLIDTPGTPELFGRAMSILPAVESVALVINAQLGVEPVSRKS